MAIEYARHALPSTPPRKPQKSLISLVKKPNCRNLHHRNPSSCQISSIIPSKDKSNHDYLSLGSPIGILDCQIPHLIRSVRGKYDDYPLLKQFSDRILDCRCLVGLDLPFGLAGRREERSCGVLVGLASRSRSNSAGSEARLARGDRALSNRPPPWPHPQAWRVRISSSWKKPGNLRILGDLRARVLLCNTILMAWYGPWKVSASGSPFSLLQIFLSKPWSGETPHTLLHLLFFANLFLHSFANHLFIVSGVMAASSMDKGKKPLDAESLGHLETKPRKGPKIMASGFPFEGTPVPPWGVLAANQKHLEKILKKSKIEVQLLKEI